MAKQAVSANIVNKLLHNGEFMSHSRACNHP
jgi:hypothetical protein